MGKSIYGYRGAIPAQNTTGNKGILSMEEHRFIKQQDRFAEGFPPVPSGMSLRFLFTANNYSGSGSTWTDETGNNHDATLYNVNYTSGTHSYFTLASNFSFSLGNNSLGSNLTMFWVMQTNDTQAVIATSSSGNDYLGAYRSGNAYYHNNVGGNKTLYRNSTNVSDLYNNIRGNDPRLITISDCDFSFTNQQYHFGNYGSFEFGDGKLYACGAYNGNLSSSNVAALADYYDAQGFI
jgi:hypothetical protein